MKDYLGSMIFARDEKGTILLPQEEEGRPILPTDSKGRVFTDKLYGQEEYVTYCYQQIKEKRSFPVFFRTLLSLDRTCQVTPTIKSLPPILEAKYQVLGENQTHILFENFPNLLTSLKTRFANDFSSSLSVEPLLAEGKTVGLTFKLFPRFFLKEGHFRYVPYEETDRRDEWQEA